MKKSVFTIKGIHPLAAGTYELSLTGDTSAVTAPGQFVNLELPELGEMVSLLRRSSNNLNQLTKRVHETGQFYDADLEDLRRDYDGLWDAAQKILFSLAKLQ